MSLLRACVPLFVIGCGSLPVSFPQEGGSSGGTVEQSPAAAAHEVVRHTNEARRRNGLPEFRANAQLMEAARLHAEQMAAYQRAEHTIQGARYPTMQSRLAAAGYAWRSAAENVAWNQPNAKVVVDGWMRSPGHRANILDADLTEMGAAMARSRNGEPYWIQVFGRPR